MTSPKHTPAPWHACKDGCTCGLIWSLCGNINIATAHWSNNAARDDWNSRETWPVSLDTAQANARLIAAAPELLEYVASSAIAGCATARLLVAKATGGAP